MGYVHVFLMPGVSAPLELELEEVVSCMIWVLGAELCLLQEQYVLLTPKEPSLCPGTFLHRLWDWTEVLVFVKQSLY